MCKPITANSERRYNHHRFRKISASSFCMPKLLDTSLTPYRVPFDPSATVDSPKYQYVICFTLLTFKLPIFSPSKSAFPIRKHTIIIRYGIAIRLKRRVGSILLDMLIKLSLLLPKSAPLPRILNNKERETNQTDQMRLLPMK